MFSYEVGIEIYDRDAVEEVDEARVFIVDGVLA